MIAYSCKQCGRVTILGYKNGYEEHFCSYDCYKKYCKKNNYTYRPEDITQVKNALTK